MAQLRRDCQRVLAVLVTGHVDEREPIEIETTNAARPVVV
jgi:hypothetical protein